MTSDAGGPAFVAPEVGDTVVRVNGKAHAVRAAAPVPIEETAPTAPSTAFAGPDVGPTAFPPLALKPSAEDARIVEEIDLGARLPFAGSPDMDQSIRLTGS